MVLRSGINKVISNEEMKLPDNPHDIVKKFKCEDVDEQKDCMMGDDDYLSFRMTKIS